MSVRTHHIPAARPEEGKSPPARWLALAVLCVSLIALAALPSRPPRTERRH
jgi:hypothetical protein